MLENRSLLSGKQLSTGEHTEVDLLKECIWLTSSNCMDTMKALIIGSECVLIPNFLFFCCSVNSKLFILYCDKSEMYLCRPAKLLIDPLQANISTLHVLSNPSYGALTIISNNSLTCYLFIVAFSESISLLYPSSMLSPLLLSSSRSVLTFCSSIRSILSN